jgi:hypothetical protein
MSFLVVPDINFIRDIDSFAEYARAYSDDFAREQFERLKEILSVDLAEAPHIWGFFFITGAPYRAYLFRGGRRTSYWIVYAIDEGASRRFVTVLERKPARRIV